MVINATNLKFFAILPAILFMWINYLFFCTGYSIILSQDNSFLSINLKSRWYNKHQNFFLFALSGISIIFSILAVNFYTGQTPYSTFLNLRNSVSIYYEYQKFFKEQQIYVFSFKKLPYIFMLFFIKIVTFYSYILFFIFKKKMNKCEKLYLIIITFSFLYVGIARGTSFEIFEILMLCIFILLIKRKIGGFRYSRKWKIIILLLNSLMLYILHLGIRARGVTDYYNISLDVFYDPNSILPFFSNFLTTIVLMLFGYFGFGFFYISIYITDIWFSSFEKFFAGLLPLNHIILNVKPLHETMHDLIDMGARWQPDSALFIDYLGYIGLLTFCFLMGVISRFCLRIQITSPMVYLTIFIILLQMISLPVGNFIIVSSASLLIIFSLTIYWFFNIFLKHIYRFKWR